MKLRARNTAMYGAAVLASGIAVISAIEAWIRLQDPAGAASLASNLAAEAGLAIALPLLAVAAVVGLRWGARSLVKGGASTGGIEGWGRRVVRGRVPGPRP